LKTYIAFNEKNPNRVCIVKSESILNSGNYNSTPKSFSATDWNGNDDLKRTLQLCNLKVVGSKISLGKLYSYSGTDSDMGHEYYFKFVFDSLLECVNKK